MDGILDDQGVVFLVDVLQHVAGTQQCGRGVCNVLPHSFRKGMTGTLPHDKHTTLFTVWLWGDKYIMLQSGCAMTNTPCEAP